MRLFTKINSRILSVLISAVLICTMFQTPVLAAEGRTPPLYIESIGTIRSFERLEEPFFLMDDSGNVYYLTVARGVSQRDLNLPDELTAMVEWISRAAAPEEDPIETESEESEPEETKSEESEPEETESEKSGPEEAETEEGGSVEAETEEGGSEEAETEEGGSVEAETEEGGSEEAETEEGGSEEAETEEGGSEEAETEEGGSVETETEEGGSVETETEEGGSEEAETEEGGSEEAETGEAESEETESGQDESEEAQSKEHDSNEFFSITKLSTSQSNRLSEITGGDTALSFAPVPEAFTVKTETIPVTWISDSPYDPEADNGSYIFTARLPDGYDLGDGVIEPEIHVMVGAALMLADTSYDISTAPVNITTAGTYEITGNSTQNTVTVDVASGIVTITFIDLAIESDNEPAFKITDNSAADITIELLGASLLRSTYENFAGLQKKDKGTLTITGDGTLTATSKSGAGIGGGITGNISIKGNATVTATSESGAGIGGGIYSNGSNITITDYATVNAASINGAGIGGGFQGDGSNITIEGNATVTATSSGTGAGIGGGYSGIRGGQGSYITIQGNAVVTAKGGSGGAGIGGGNLGGYGHHIIITDNAVVTTTSIAYGAGIGGGLGGDGDNIAISGNSLVTTTGGAWAAGIGGGNVFDSNGGKGRDNSIDGNAVVFAATILDSDPVHGMSLNNGILFEETTGTMVGNVTLSRNIEIPKTYTLTVPFGFTLTNDGELSVYGTLDYGGVNGDLINSGILNLPSSTSTLTAKKGGQAITEAEYGDVITLEAVAHIDSTRSRNAARGQADFYIYNNSNQPILLGLAATSFDGSAATANLSVSLTGRDWDAYYLPKTLRAEYGGTTSESVLPGNIGLIDGIAEGLLLVNRKVLTTSGIVPADRIYDGTTYVSLSGGTLIGVVPGETVPVPTEGLISDKNIGNNKPVTHQIKFGPQTSNYTLEEPSGLTVNILPADPLMVFPATQEILVYTGNAAIITEPVVTLLNSETYSGSFNYSYQSSVGTSYQSGLPTEAGTYKIKAQIEPDGNYAGAVSTNGMVLTIEKSASTLTINSYTGSIYTGQASADPTDILSSLIDPIVTYAWYADNNGIKGDLLPGAPTEVGTYHVEGSIAGTVNTTAVTSSPVSFTIGKADAPAANTGSLAVFNNEAHTYTYDLTHLLPPGLHVSGETYEINMSAPNSYYNPLTSENISDSMLTLPINAVDSTVEGGVGVISIRIKSQNYKDMEALITVNAVNKAVPPVTEEPAVPPVTEEPAVDGDSSHGSNSSSRTQKSQQGQPVIGEVTVSGVIDTNGLSAAVVTSEDIAYALKTAQDKSQIPGVVYRGIAIYISMLLMTPPTQQ